MNIYVASSWRNAWQQPVVRLLREMGHEVYDFKDPKNNPGGFHWSDIDPQWQLWTPSVYREALDNDVAKRGFKADMDALEASDVCLLVQPCGTSSHLELGWAVGTNEKWTAVLFPFGFEAEGEDRDGSTEKLKRIEPELMVKMCDKILLGRDELVKWISGIEVDEMMVL